MGFLVRIQVNLPPDVPAARRQELIDAEGRRGRELAAAGTLRRLWRIPGRWANVGIWSAPDATSLHHAISSLPLYDWLDVEVTPLAHHPTDPGGDAG